MNSKEIIKQESKNLHHFNYRGAFMSGYYEGHYPLSDVLKKGDFGLGTFNNLNGEMVVLDGKIFRGKPDGNAELVTELSEQSPSAVVTFFNPDMEIKLQNMSTDSLKRWLKRHLNTEKKMYALKLNGTFQTVTTRSQEKIMQKPFPVIEDVVENMVYHDLNEVDGTLVGFQLPPYLGLINYPGLHFHFVGENKGGAAQSAGCAPKYLLKEGLLQIMEMTSFSVDIPQDPAYEEMEIIPEKVNVM